MSLTFEAFLRSWPFDPLLIVSLVLTAGVYLHGWLALNQRKHRYSRSNAPLAFVSGLAVLFLALGSPIEPFSGLLLQVHMVQHLFLMMVAPPLLWLGQPFLPLLRGLPRSIRNVWISPVIGSPILQQIAQKITHPLLALSFYVAATLGWHIPALYEMALRSSGWHYVQHFCFFIAGLLFWYPVVRPHPCQPNWSLWLLAPYLIVADVQNTVLAAVLTFSDKVLYSYYNEVPRIAGFSALQDQAAAGVIMWVPGSIAFLVPLSWIAIGLLDGSKGDSASGVGVPVGVGDVRKKKFPSPQPSPYKAGARGPDLTWRVPLPILSQAAACSSCRQGGKSGLDLLRVPGLGLFLRWRHARISLQLPLLVLAAVVIVDGLRGPQMAPMNLAGVLPWIHWRGILIVALLAAGNIFCLGCPFMLPRTLARRWISPRWNWPRRLRNKWLAVVLVGIYLWAYEALALWNSPWWTAWIAVIYFALVFVIDGLFRGASFCKYVCPIGQFNFVQSLVSPLEVQVREPLACSTCLTRDCIQGRDDIPGCELLLFQPRKTGNMDCTFCLDCAHACPHENIGIIAGLPGRNLWNDESRSGIGRFSRRRDLAALVVILVFGAFANAAGMVGPVQEWQLQLQNQLGLRSPMLLTSILYFCSLFLLPLIIFGAASLVSRRLSRCQSSAADIGTHFAFSLVPLGFGMWLAHYSFHLLTSCAAVMPAVQRLARDLGWKNLGKPVWLGECCRQVGEWLPRMEIVFLELGLLMSLYVGYRIALIHCPRPSLAAKQLFPWAAIMLFLFAAGVWILFQPMQMRGTMLGAN